MKNFFCNYKSIIFIIFLSVSTNSAKCQTNENNPNFSQPEYSLYWDGAKLFLEKTHLNPLLVSIMEKTLPKVFAKDVKGALSEFSSIVYENTKIKAINPIVFKYLENKYYVILNQIAQNNYLTITMTICDIAIVTDNYINKNIIPDVSNLNTNKASSNNIDSLALSKEIEKLLICKNINLYIKLYESEYFYKEIGGVSDYKFGITNNTGYTIDNVQVLIESINPNTGSTFCSEKVTFSNIPPYSKSNEKIFSCNRGKRVNCKIIRILSNDLRLK